LLVGSITGYKKEIRNLISFQKNQITKFGVQCHLGQEVTLETIKEFKPDVVILATGSLPSLPPVKGIDNGIVVPFTKLLNGGDSALKKTVIIGGGPTGCEVAFHLSEQGCPVTLVELLPKVGASLESMTRKIMLRKLRENQVRIMTEYKLSEVKEEGVVLEGKDGQKVFVAAERVVVTIGNRPDTRLFDQIKPLGYEIHQIGDCLEPRSAKAAIYEGAVLGRAI
jgi:pyruvate/2-oxoglutarate dehydrogenase complex dihydrolipoamide dehydrogenase (E3) component